MRNLRTITAVLLIIGGLNWGLVGFFQYDLVAAIFGGSDSTLSRLIYSLVGLSALHQIFAYPRGYEKIPVVPASGETEYPKKVA